MDSGNSIAGGGARNGKSNKQPLPNCSSIRNGNKKIQAQKSLSCESIQTLASASSSRSTVMGPSSARDSSSDENSDTPMPIGLDVIRFCSLLEKSGLCGPTSGIAAEKGKSSTSTSRPGTANSIPPASPRKSNTVERPRTASGDRSMGKKKTSNVTPPQTARPSTASARTPVSFRLSSGASSIGMTNRPSTRTTGESSIKTTRTSGGENTERRHNKTSGYTTVEPNSFRKNVTPSFALSATGRPNNLLRRSRSIGSQNISKIPANRPSSSRPEGISTSSTLFQHTASSARKGMHSHQKHFTPNIKNSNCSPRVSLSKSRPAPTARPRTVL